MPIDFGSGWLSRAIASFAEKYPSIDLEIHVNGRWVDVSEESYDVAIHLGPLLNPDVPFRRLSALTRGVYASPEYLARKAPSISLWNEHALNFAAASADEMNVAGKVVDQPVAENCVPRRVRLRRHADDR